MKCPQCLFNGADHEQVVQRCLSSPLWTGIYLCGFSKFDNGFHRAITEWYLRKMEEGKRRFIVMTPRGALKTSLFGIANIVWRVIRNPEERILYVMASSTEANKTLNAIRKVFESENMQHYFPQRALTDKKGTTAKEFFLTVNRIGTYREHTIEARGVNSTITGGHFPVQIFDDLIDKTMMDSAQKQDKVIDFFKDATNMFVDPNEDHRLVIGTWWEGPFYEWLIEESGIADHYEKLIIGAKVDTRYRNFLASIGKKILLEDGKGIWPQHFTDDMLNYVLVEEGPVFFARQYLNIKTTDEDRRFREDDFRHYRFDEETKYVKPYDNDAYKIPIARLYRTLMCDPATGKHKKTDDSAISVCGFDVDTGKIFILEEWAGKVQPNALIDQILRLAEKWNPHIVGIEEASFQNVLRVYLRQEMAARGSSFAIRAVKPGNRSKVTRIDGLQPFVRNHQIFVQDYQYKLVKELTNLQVIRGEIVGKSPNRADALAYHVEFWKHKKSDSTKFDEDDIPNWKPKKQVRSYGLECVT